MADEVLIIDDDARLAAMLGDYLGSNGYSTARAGTGRAGVEEVRRRAPDAVILDVMLPDIDGFEACRQIRAFSDVPVLMLTAKGDETDRIVGLELGADDYLPKPFRMEELVARLRAIVRRAAGHAAPIITVGEVTLDPRQMRVSVRGVPVALSPQEYRLVAYLMHHRGRVVTQLELTEHLYHQDIERDSNAIEVLVGRVRRKLGVNFIETRRGFGYIVPESAGPETSG